jgi:hypothetical protein
MRPRGFNLATVIEEIDTADSLTERDENSRKQYRRHRSLRTAKRSSSRMGSSQPGVGIAGRRNRRWSW